MILSITIVAILIMAVAVPIFSDATKPATQLNDCRFAAVSQAQDMTITASLADGIVTVASTAGTMCTFQGTDTVQTIPIMADTALIQIKYTASSMSYSYSSISGSSSDGSGGFTITLKNGVLNPNGAEISWIIVPSDSGNLGCINPANGTGTAGAWANSGQTMFWGYQSYISAVGENEILIGYGDPWDPSSITVNAKASRTTWTGSPSSVEVLEDGPRAKKFGGLIFDDAILDTFDDAALVFAPVEYTPNTSSGGSSDQVNTLVNLIPMIMVAGLVTAVAASYVRRRMEE